MISCDTLPPNDRLVFSDDRALLPIGFNDYIQHWLSEFHPGPCLMLREPLLVIDYSETADVMEIIVKHVVFQTQYWQLDNMRRLFRAAICTEYGWQILGPEIDPKTCDVIAPSPVDEVVIRMDEQPPASVHELAKMSAEVWAGLTDIEREQHPRIGQVAAMADLDTIL